MSYLLLHRWFVACLILLAVACAIIEVRRWRVHAARLAKHWKEHQCAFMYVDDEPWDDPRGSRKQFEQIKRMYRK